MAGALRDEGVRPGDVVVHRFRDHFLHARSCLATAALGATTYALPVGPVSLEEANNLRRIRAHWLVSDIDDPAPEGLTMITPDMSKSGPAEIMPAPDAPWLIASSSGTTGTSKLLPVTHAQQFARVGTYESWMPMAAGDVFTSLVPMDYPGGKGYLAWLLHAGLPNCLRTRKVIGVDKPGAATVVYGTVAHVEALMRRKEILNRAEHKNPIALILVGSRASEELRHRIVEEITDRIHIIYGTTEAGHLTATPPPRSIEDPDSIGFMIDDVELQVVDAEGNTLPDGEAGELRIRTPGMIEFYLDGEAETAASFRDGWLYPHDMAVKADDGSFRLLGRSDEAMKMSGRLVFPSMIEAAMLKHPAVSQAIAFSLPDPLFQEKPVVVVTLKEEGAARRAELEKHAFAQLAAVAPKHVVIAREIPLTSRQKPDRIKLRQMAEIAAIPRPAARNRLPHPMQPMTGISLKFEAPPAGAAAQIRLWLREAFAGEGAVTGEDTPEDYLSAILELLPVMARAAQLPLFTPARASSPKPEGTQYAATIALPMLERVGHDLYHELLRQTFAIAVLIQGKVPDAAARAEIYARIQKDLINPFTRHLTAAFGKSTQPVLRAAWSGGIPFSHLGGGVFHLGWGAHGRKICRSTTEGDSSLGQSLANNKALAAELLNAAGLPGPRHVLIGGEAGAREAFRIIGAPAVVKPADSERGEGVTVDVMNEDQAATACKSALAASRRKQVLVEQQVEGTCHRLFIAGGRLLYAVKRWPVLVTGDGKNTIRDLVETARGAEERQPPWLRSLVFPSGDELAGALQREGLKEEAIPEAGTRIPLRRIKSTAAGGVDEEVTQEVHPENIRIALEAVRLLSLDVGGVDIITTDISRPWHETGAIINEVNYAPLLGGAEISRQYLGKFLYGQVGAFPCIPVTVFVGAGAWEAAETYWQHRKEEGVAAVITSHERTVTAWAGETPMRGESLAARIRALKLSPRAEEMIIVIASEAALGGSFPLGAVSRVVTVDQELPAEFLKAIDNLPRLEPAPG